MNQDEVKVSFYLKKSESNEQEKCPVIARLSVGKYSKVAFSAKMLVPSALWASGRATGKSAIAREINIRLDEIRASAFSIYRELSALRENVTAEEVRCILLGMASNQQTLLSYFRAFNENFDKRVGVNREKISAYSYWYTLKHVMEFLQAKYKLSDIPFTALDRSFIDKFDLYLRTEICLSLRTIGFLTTRLKTIVGNAVVEGLLSTYPFTGYEVQRPQQEQKYLTAEELNRLMTTPLHQPKLYHIRDLFLFSCYTGIPYGDMCCLTQDDLEISEDGVVWIKSSRKKTKIDYELPLLDLPLYILDKYQNTAPDGRLLPMYDNRELNLQLKILAKICGINRHLTFHMARHTYATEITLAQGVPLETVSRMLGHSAITTTQIYAKVTDNKIDGDTQALNECITQRFVVAI